MTVLGAAASAAQDAVVRSFEAAPMDVTAQQYARKDLHGEKCALVKVRVVAQGVTFSGSVMGEVEKRGSEYWVYMPGGTKMLQVTAESFLPFLYTFPEPLRGGVTYVLTIESPQPAATAPQKPDENYFVLRVEPAHANVFVDGNPLAVEDGAVTVPLTDGTHSYRVESVGFAPEEGTVTMAGKRESRTVTLRSTKPTLTINAATPATEIYVNDARKGVGSWSGELFPGTYMVEGRLASHRTHTRKVTLTEGHDQTITIPALTAITGTLNVNYKPLDAAITIDGNSAGVTPNIITDLLVGTHTVVISKDGYTPITRTTSVSETSTATLSGTLSRADIAQPSARTPSAGTDPYSADAELTKEYKYFINSYGKYGFKHNDRVVVPPQI